jgi:hypothetical protein
MPPGRPRSSDTSVSSTRLAACNAFLARLALVAGGSPIKGEETMTFVPGFQHDIFVSYAQVDNDPVPGVDDGWVTCLVKNLEWRLRQLCGRRDAYSLWMDLQLARHVRITPEIMETLEQTALLLVVLSPGYLASDWCRREREAFLQIVQQHMEDKKYPRVFVVARDKVDQWPSEFGDLLGYQFWTENDRRQVRIMGSPVPNPEHDQEYFNKVWDLAGDMHRELSRLKMLAQNRPPSQNGKGDRHEVNPGLEQSHDTTRCTIYLAEATDDLDLEREQVRRYLGQHGLRVLPEKWYSREPDEFRDAVERDLEDSALFVQLLSTWPGKKLPGAVSSYVALQYQYALAAGKPILQWCRPNLLLETIVDADHRALFETSTLLVTDLEAFKREITSRASREMDKKKADSARKTRSAVGQPFVFVNIGRDDLDTAERLCETIEHHGCGVAIPMHEGQSDDIRRDLEENLLDCDGLIVVYGRIPESWVRQQLREWRKILYRREKPLRALAVYEGPPPESKRPLGMRLPDMHVIDCRNGLNESHLQQFLDTLTAEVSP